LIRVSPGRITEFIPELPKRHLNKWSNSHSRVGSGLGGGSESTHPLTLAQHREVSPWGMPLGYFPTGKEHLARVSSSWFAGSETPLEHRVLGSGFEQTSFQYEYQDIRAATSRFHNFYCLTSCFSGDYCLQGFIESTI
jgi:hypothetical protein